MEEHKLLKRKTKALNENNQTLLLATCTDLAAIYMESNNYESALEHYNLLANIYRQQNKNLDYACVNRGIGEAYVGLKDFQKALKHQHIFLDIARQETNQIEEQRALATIGHTHFLKFDETCNREDLNLAYNFFMKSLKVCQSLTNINKLEHADMTARIYANLGLVQESQENLNEAINLLKQSIEICKTNDIYEQLQRGYMAMGSVLEKQNESNESIHYYNLAIDVAKRLSNKSTLISSALSAKSLILVKIGDLQSAKYSLIKAYRLKTTNHIEFDTIQRNLKIVITMCNIEKQLLQTDNSDYIALKKLYEQMGDAACALKIYTKAIDYYKKMLEAALNGSLNGNDLSSCYYSIAETYKDINQLDTALIYYQKEYEIAQKNLKDNLDSLCLIIDTKESLDHSATEIKQLYMKAIADCRNEMNKHEEGRMLKRLIAYLKRHKKEEECPTFEEAFEKTCYESSDDESELEPQQSPEIGADVDLDHLSDVEIYGDSDGESTSKTQKRTKTYTIKRNIKGETQLHTACINGKLNVVKHLLEQGHPVNVRDNCGWLPLHEACIWGHDDIVRVLLDKGAAINDRGGTHCNGVTPLYDAASNGHLAIVKLLLDNGASAIVKTDDGETVLDILKKWHNENTDIESEDEEVYNELVKRLSLALNKVGGNGNERSPIANRSKLSLKRTLSSHSPSSSNQSATNEYRNVMSSLRRPRNVTLNQLKSPVKRPALLPAEEMLDDDWLENDMEISNKKRKINHSDAYISSFNERKSSNKRNSDPIRQIRKSPVEKRYEIPDDDFDMELISSTSPTIEKAKSLTNLGSPRKSNSPTTSKTKSIPKIQTKLTNYGLVKNVVEADSTTRKPKPNTTPSMSEQFQSSTDPTLFVEVRIEEKLFRVPVLLSQINTKTIKWLAEEAATRYAKKEYMKPTLELETTDNAILANDDTISLLFPIGGLQSEQVIGRIINWNLPPLVDRYREACLDLNSAANQKLLAKLEYYSTVLDLSNMGLQGKILNPLCKALNHQHNLMELDISGNFLTIDSMKLFAGSLITLKNLITLNLSCTGLTVEHFRILTEGITSVNLDKLIDLDLSDNFISDASLRDLEKISRQFRLKSLNLASNQLTGNFNDDINLTLYSVEDLNLANNQLKNEGVFKFLTWTNWNALKKLDVSRNRVGAGFLEKLVKYFNANPVLENINLSRCQITDEEIFMLIDSAIQLETIDLSYNPELTGLTFGKLLGSNLKIIKLYGCDNIFKHFNSTRINKLKCKQLKIDYNNESDNEIIEKLQNLWTDFHQEKTKIESTNNFITFSSG